MIQSKLKKLVSDSLEQVTYEIGNSLMGLLSSKDYRARETERGIHLLYNGRLWYTEALHLFIESVEKFPEPIYLHRSYLKKILNREELLQLNENTFYYYGAEIVILEKSYEYYEVSEGVYQVRDGDVDYVDFNHIGAPRLYRRYIIGSGIIDPKFRKAVTGETTRLAINISVEGYNSQLFCDECGYEQPKDSSYCINCGKKL